MLIAAFVAIAISYTCLMTIETNDGLLVHSIANFTRIPAAIFLLGLPGSLLLFIPTKNFRYKISMITVFLIASVGLLILFLIPSAIILMRFYN